MTENLQMQTPQCRADLPDQRQARREHRGSLESAHEGPRRHPHPQLGLLHLRDSPARRLINPQVSQPLQMRRLQHLPDPQPLVSALCFDCSRRLVGKDADAEKRGSDTARHHHCKDLGGGVDG